MLSGCCKQGAVDKAFGSFDQMKEKFNAAAASRFGSGWAWLGVKPDGSLAVTSTANQASVSCFTGEAGCGTLINTPDAAADFGGCLVTVISKPGNSVWSRRAASS